MIFCLQGTLLRHFAGIPLINVRDIPLDDLERASQTGISILFLPLSHTNNVAGIFWRCVLAIKFTSLGPTIFKQERMGLNRRNFHMYKFRSMQVSSPKTSDTGNGRLKMTLEKQRWADLFARQA